MKKFLLLILAVFMFSGIYASDDDFFFSEDSMFFDDGMLEEITEEDSEEKGENSIFDFGLIETETLRFGGSSAFALNYSAIWTDVFSSPKEEKYFANGFYNSMLIPSLSASLYFDARPNETLRLYGKVETAYPFEISVPMTGLSIPQFRIKELFTDFNIGEHSYFRFGKHTVTWGVGYFFSPADVINIGKIDPENPENQVEGAISLRSMFTFPGTQNCLYLYLIPTGMEEGFLARNTAFAGKYDFLLGNTEIGIGGWYKYNRSPRLVSTLTSTIFRDVSVFGEVVFAYGTEEQWIASKSFENKDFVLQGTFGFSKYFKNPKINLASQYLFNGFGENDPTSLVDEKFLTKQGLYGYVGKHFLALSLTKSELFTEKLSLSGFCLMSFSDFSGMGNLSLNYNLDKNCNISLGPNLVFGKENSEFARTSEKNMFSFDVSVKLGGGKF